MEEKIVEIVLGIFILYLSYQIGIKKNVSLLHSYHYTNLDISCKNDFCKRIGVSQALVGVGILCMPILNGIGFEDVSYYIGLFITSVGMVLSLFYIIRYNGHLISFRKK